MNSRTLVLQTMQGRATRIPVYFWLADPELEARIGDVVGVRCWFKCLDFLEKGGPFKKGEETRREWCNRLDPAGYDWPQTDALFLEMDRIVTETVKVDRSKSFQLEILGPTEYAEYACSAGKTVQARRLDQVFHQFDFSILTLLDPQKANDIHRRLFNLLLAVAKRATEYQAIDSIRIADDFCTYTGSAYRPDFTGLIVSRQIELGRVIMRGGKYSVLHSDGDLRGHFETLANVYSGFHPLDLRSKATVTEAHHWADMLATIRSSLPETVFFTGLPIDLLCNAQVSANDLVSIARHVVESVGPDRLVLTTTHRPYPGWSFLDFREKVDSVRRFLQSVSHDETRAVKGSN